MTPRVRYKALTLFQDGYAFNKYFLSEVAHCDQRTAQRALKRLHEMRLVVISDWCKIYKKWIPIYRAAGRGRRDKPRPEAVTREEINAKRLADPEYMMRELKRKRAKRILNKDKHEINSLYFPVGHSALDVCSDGIAEGKDGL